jgi:hypothetical protein
MTVSDPAITSAIPSLRLSYSDSQASGLTRFWDCDQTKAPKQSDAISNLRRLAAGHDKRSR